MMEKKDRQPTGRAARPRSERVGRWRWCVVLVLLACGYAARAEMKFRGYETLPTLGLRLPLPAQAQAVPLPPLTVYDYRLERGAETWTEQRFAPYDLWYEAQHVGMWRDAAGNSVRLGVMSTILPRGLSGKHVTREHYEQLSASAMSEAQALNEDMVQRWMLDFTGVRLGAPQALVINKQRFAQVLRFPTENARTHAYAFCFDTRRAGQAHMSGLWMGLVVVSADQDTAANMAAIESELIGGMSPTSRFEQPSSVERRFAAAAQKYRQHPTRDAAHRSVEALADWWHLDSEDFVLLSNHRAAQRFAADILDDLQAARNMYARMVPAFAESVKDVAVVRIFATDAEYEAYVGREQAWSGGIFDPSRRELVIRPPKARGRDAQYQRMLRVALHEGFHQYLFQATGGLPTSVWFNEGHATFFEVAVITERRVKLEENSARVDRLMQQVRSKKLGLRDLLGMSYADFYSGSDADREARYSLAWGLAYYLQRGAPLERGRPHGAVLTRYMQALAQTGDPARATAFAFDGIAIDSFERAFIEFWTTPRYRSTAKRAALP